MIQRIQTIILLLAAGVFGSLFALPMAATAEPTAQGIFTDSVFDLADSTLLIALVGVGIAVALIAMLSYKNRKRQVLFGYLGMLVAVAVAVAAFLALTQSHVSSTYQAGMFLPAAAVVLFGIANYFIRKDDKLVRSMDRLR